MFKKTLFAGIIGVLTLAVPFAVSQAAQYFPTDKTNTGAVVVGGSQEFRNLYTGGGSVVVSKQVLGDLFVGGGSITIAGPVEKDLFAAGGNVTVANPVGDDIRLAGGNIAVNASVGGDLLLAGGTLTLTENARVGGDMWIAGGIVNFNGTAGGSAKVTGGEIFINGTITGPLEVRAQKKLTFGPQSKVTGPIAYSGPGEAVVQEGAQIGTVQFTPIQGGKTMDRRIPMAIFAGIGVLFFIKIAALLIASLVLLSLFRKTSNEIVSSGKNNFWANLGIGFAGMILIPVAAVILVATLIGAYLGAALGIWFVFSILMAGVAMVMTAGTFVQTWLSRKESSLSWKTVLWGILALAILDLIPFIGWLVIAILFFASLGALLRTARKQVEA